MSRWRDPELTEMLSFRCKPGEKEQLDRAVQQLDPHRYQGGRSGLIRVAVLEYLEGKLMERLEGVA
jgi:hypothetical protein